MASSSKAPCATCGNKGVGIFRCEGCLQVFCRKHLNEHRDFLSHQLDEIVLEHDTLQQTIAQNKGTQNNQHPVLKQIDKWEKDSIRKVQQLAEEARQQVKELIGTQTVSKELHDLAERLQKARIDDDYVETDLRIWMTKVQKLKDDVHTFSPSIYIQEDPAETLVAKMYVAKSKDRSRQTERFGESFGNIRIEENGLVAIHCGPENGKSLVHGIGEYSSGTQKIRFLFKKSSLIFITSFEIISKLKRITPVRSNSSYRSYGWNSNDDAFGTDAYMTVDENFQDMKGQTTFEIELQLDCDNRKISYVNQRTKNRREMNVDITKCPFPWQVRFYLYKAGDCVRFLP